MNLPTRILFASSALACAALCAWAAISFGGPATTTMWMISGGLVVVAIVIWLIKDRPPETLASIRVEGAREPTYRLERSEAGAKGEIWQLVLANSHCTLIRPDGAQSTSFARKWFDMAVHMPGFVSGEMLRIVKEDWTPPEDGSGITAGDLLHAARSIRRTADREADFYWFKAPNDLVTVIEEYRRRTFAELGAEVAGPLRIKARGILLTGGIGLVAGIALLAFGIMSAEARADAPATKRTRTIALGAVIAMIGLWRLGHGISVYRQSRQVSQD
jgi:hypothetical protein